MRAHGLIFPAARRRFGGALSRGRHSQASSGRECACLLPLPPSTHTHTRFANCPRVCQLQGMVSVEGQAQRTAMAAAIAGEYGGLCSFKNQMTHDAMSYLAGRFDRGEVDGEKVKQYVSVSLSLSLCVCLCVCVSVSLVCLPVSLSPQGARVLSTTRRAGRCPHQRLGPGCAECKGKVSQAVHVPAAQEGGRA